MLTMAKKKVETEQVNVRISTVLLERLERIGDPLGLTRTQLVLRAVEEYVLRHEADSPARPHPRR